ncbi:MAG: hypothetical protein KatS3mg002_1339 [Candidatus Woesearchaeota archaeon]|nr:MAG: hypothetical protein KatS3mg002_1339 [Candidatus Woesearchaeota archaeon]
MSMLIIPNIKHVLYEDLIKEIEEEMNILQSINSLKPIEFVKDGILDNCLYLCSMFMNSKPIKGGNYTMYPGSFLRQYKDNKIGTYELDDVTFDIYFNIMFKIKYSSKISVERYIPRKNEFGNIQKNFNIIDNLYMNDIFINKHKDTILYSIINKKKYMRYNRSNIKNVKFSDYFFTKSLYEYIKSLFNSNDDIFYKKMKPLINDVTNMIYVYITVKEFYKVLFSIDFHFLLFRHAFKKDVICENKIKEYNDIFKTNDKLTNIEKEIIISSINLYNKDYVSHGLENIKYGHRDNDILFTNLTHMFDKDLSFVYSIIL